MRIISNDWKDCDSMAFPLPLLYLWTNDSVQTCSENTSDVVANPGSNMLIFFFKREAVTYQFLPGVLQFLVWTDFRFWNFSNASWQFFPDV